ncbi:alginate O-acetylation protein [Spirochaetia bacterium]|nr:alginate O-acetylation protein [Spirochaetia bacterium]
MSFSSSVFILYFLPAALILYYLCWFSRPLQNLVLLTASLVFYAFGQTTYFIILIFSVLWNWMVGMLIGMHRGRWRTVFLAAGCLVNLGVLLFFKQLPPFINAVFAGWTPWAPVPITPVSKLVPLGLSYYTLQACGYCVDVYRRTYGAEKNPLMIGLYLSFFPKMAAGPLIPYADMKEQLLCGGTLRRKFSPEEFSAGLCRFACGLAKIVLFGGSMARISDYVFIWSEMGQADINVPALLAWVGLLALSLKIYYQLSGYADAAVGLGLMFGIRLPENFNYPFYSPSLTIFWQRWNITVLGWFREYAFPFLRQFNRRKGNMDMVILHLFFTWVLFAFWHGSGWTRFFWGALQFLFLLVEHFFSYFGIPRDKWYMRVYTLVVVILSFVFLRTVDLYQAGAFFRNLFGANHNGFFSAVAWVFVRENWIWLAGGILFCFPFWSGLRNRFQAKFAGWVPVSLALYPILMAALLAVTLIFMSQDILVPFEYY